MIRESAAFEATDKDYVKYLTILVKIELHVYSKLDLVSKASPAAAEA